VRHRDTSANSAGGNDDTTELLKKKESNPFLSMTHVIMYDTGL